MSSSAPGKFQDHYAVLGVDPKSDSETIQQAYAKLAQRYNPKNSATADAEKFEAINLAYEVLSDAELRSGFDKLKGVGQENTPKFSGPGFFDALGRETLMRSAVLCILYDRRRTKPSTPSLSMRRLENILDATTDELTSVLWYLKQRGLVASDDKSSLQITVDGMDFLESRKPSPDEVMPFIKPDGLAQPPSKPVQSNQPAQPESILSVMNRARRGGQS